MTIKQVNTNKMLVQCLPHRKDYLRINYFVVVSEHISFQDKEASLSPIYMLLLKENTISFTHLQEITMLPCFGQHLLHTGYYLGRQYCSPALSCIFTQCFPCQTLCIGWTLGPCKTEPRQLLPSDSALRPCSGSQSGLTPL